MWHRKGNPNRKVYSHDAYIKKTEISQLNDIILYLKLLEKTRTNQTIRRRREKNKYKGKNPMTYRPSYHTKNQWNRKLFPWKNKQDWQIPGKSD
jgi:uncharacterized protein (DUF2147 family)